MDLSVFNTTDTSEAGTWFELTDFDGVTLLGASILVMGPDSQEASRIADEEEKMTSRKLAEAFATANKQPVKDTDKELSSDRAVRKAVRITKGWKNIEWGAVILPYSTENALMLYSKVPLFRYQVLNFHNASSHFTKPEYANWRRLFGQGSSLTPPINKELPYEVS